jgi:hypothetical protein
MAGDLAVDVDLEFSVQIPGSRTLTGSLTGSGTTLELQVSDPLIFSGRADSGAIRGLAQSLAGNGLSVNVVSPSGLLVTLGGPRASWLQRRLTGSRHIRIERLAGLATLIRARVKAPRGGALPAAELVPPPTLTPVAPTTARRRERPATSNGDLDGGALGRRYGAHIRRKLGDRRSEHRQAKLRRHEASP